MCLPMHNDGWLHVNVEISLDPLSFFLVSKISGRSWNNLSQEALLFLHVYVCFGVPFPRFSWGVLSLYTRYVT